MFSNIDFESDKFAVIGLGDTGLSIINYLKFKQAVISKVFDTRENPPHQDLVNAYTLCCGSLDIKQFQGIDVIVLSPGVSIYEPVLQEAIVLGKKVIGDIELFALELKNWSKTKVIGITGSNGKTTVTTLTGHLAKACGFKVMIAGNIGAPVLQSYIEATLANEIPELVVLELSSFQLETTYSLNLVSATVLNISEDHLDRYRDLLEYAYVKANIFNNSKVQILNTEDKLVVAMSRAQLTKKWFGLDISCPNAVISEHGKYHLQIEGKKFMPCSELDLVGMHNYQNVLASLLLLKAADLDIDSLQMRNGLSSFKSVEHRMEKVLTHKGIIYIDDSKGTNVGAVIAGVGGLDLPVHLILGGDGKGQDFSPLRKLVMDKCKSVAIIGQDGEKIRSVLLGLELPIQMCESLEDAVAFSVDHAQIDEYVVLSPACASWDMFDNYKHRAQVFKDSVYAYTK